MGFGTIKKMLSTKENQFLLNYVLMNKKKLEICRSSDILRLSLFCINLFYYSICLCVQISH